jgi:DNA mismatch repair protein MutS
MLAMDAFSRSALHERESTSRPQAQDGGHELAARERVHVPPAPHRGLSFHSVLFERAEHAPAQEVTEQPAFFIDLNFDQIVDAIIAVKQEYNLRPFFHAPLSDPEAITYRHEVMRDLEKPDVLRCINRFAQTMRDMREHLAKAEKLYYKHQKQSWILDAVEIYCDGAKALAKDLAQAAIKSRGLLGFREYLNGYIASDRFTSLLAETRQLKADLAAITYSMIIKDGSVTVRNYESEGDYSVEVLSTFERFKQGEAKDYLVKIASFEHMNHIEAAVIEFVARLNPEVFGRLDSYCTRNSAHVDEKIGAFDREIQFYVAYLEYTESFKRAGCYPNVSAESKEIFCRDGFDIALARKLISERAEVVSNDFHLSGSERIFVVSGPNQGGKTTFARMFGQLHYLACLGCLVPGRDARLFLFDHLFTHFEKEEDITTLRGKLEDDLTRIHGVLERATAQSIIIMNEIFNSTTLSDQILLSRRVLDEITDLDCLCVCVTFIDELASLNEKTVSMVSTIVPDNPALRTFKIVRKPADGLAYAMAIAEKYRLTYNSLKERVKS